MSLRERIIYVLSGLIACVILFDTLVVEEIRLKNHQLEEKIAQAKDDLEWMSQAVYRIPLKKTGEGKKITGRVETFIDQQISRQGLKKKMQMTPMQEHTVRIRLSEVDLKKSLQIFSTIDSYVQIKEVRITPGDKAGFVNSSLVVTNEERL